MLERDVGFSIEKLNRFIQSPGGEVKEEGNILLYHVEKTQAIHQTFKIEQ